MNVLRSPTSTGGGSQPDLSKISIESVDPHITQRNKRKQPECDCKYEVHEMRKELSGMTALLNKFIASQDQNMSDLKSQIKDIKLTTSQIALEQNNIKSQVSNIDHIVSTNEDKIKFLECELLKLKNSLPESNSSQSNLYTNENLIKELQDRTEREKNVIVIGLSEPSITDSKERHSIDEAKLYKILRTVCELPKPLKMFRLGKYDAKKDRIVKVCFESREIPKILLRNKNKLTTHGLKFFSDQTPAFDD